MAPSLLGRIWRKTKIYPQREKIGPVTFYFAKKDTFPFFRLSAHTVKIGPVSKNSRRKTTKISGPGPLHWDV